MRKKNFLIKKGFKKRWFRIRWKSCKKIHQKKVISKTSLTNMSKSEKNAFFHGVFASYFFVHFFKTFSVDSKSAWNSAFFDTHIEFLTTTNFFALFRTFCKLWLQMRRKRLKKNGKFFFYECVLEYNYASIKGYA